MAAMAASAGLAGVLIAHSTGHSSQVIGGSNQSSSSKVGAKKPAQSSPVAPSGTRSAVGKLVQYGYGELSVKVTAASSKVVSVSLTSLRTADQYSTQLARQVAPILKREVLAANSGRISAVSGATYTSEAYALSVQSALDKLGVK
jgi:uncharacterized protein with FMN-binding domain